MKMPARLYISKKQVKEINEKRKQNKDKHVERRLKVLLMHAEGKSRAEIALQTEYTVTHISKIVAKYVDYGIAAVAGNNYKANRRNMSFEEEQEILDIFNSQFRHFLNNMQSPPH